MLKRRTQKKLDETLAVLEKKGWARSTFTSKDGAVCLWTAVEHVTYGGFAHRAWTPLRAVDRSLVRQELERRLSTLYVRRWFPQTPHERISRWNDLYARSYDDVRRLLAPRDA